MLGRDEHDAQVLLVHVRRGDGAVALVAHLDGGRKHPLARARRDVLIVERFGDGVARKRERVRDVLHRDAVLFSHNFPSSRL